MRGARVGSLGRLSRRWTVAAGVLGVVLASAAPVRAQPTAPPASAPVQPAPASAPAASAPAAALRRGLEAFEYGQHARAVTLLRPLIEEDRLTGADRVQALRTLGVALFLTGRRGGAEAVFLQLLQADPRARLDPALVPPEAIAFLEEVRARHHTEIARAARAGRPSPWLNLLPPLGQFQNRQRGKAWVIVGLEATLLGLDLTTYFVARSMRRADGTVASESTFTNVKTANLVAFSLLVGTVLYGIFDGLYFYRARESAATAALVPAAMPGGCALVAAGRF